jgi:hypothetical protein
MTRRRVTVGVGVGLLILLSAVLYTQLTALSYDGLKSALRAHGAAVQDDGLGSQPFLAGTDRRLRVNGVGVDVFEYRTTFEASYDASRISADGSTFRGGLGPLGGQAAAVEFIAPPHWFRSGRVVVLYVGQQGDLLALLRQVLGPQFVGDGTIPSGNG